MRSASIFAMALTVATLLATAAPGRAEESLQALFQEANGAFWEERFVDAATTYRRLIDDFGVEDPALYYNLGTVHARQGELGKAIWAYRRASRLDPTGELGESIARNLALVQADLLERYRKELPELQFAYTEPHGLGYRVFHALEATVLRWVFAGGWVALFVALAAVRLRVGSPNALKAIAALAGLLALVFGVLWGGNVLTERTVHTGVVVSAAVELREGRHPSAPTHPLPEGLEVRILRADDPEMTRIELANGLLGWVPKHTVEPI